MQRVQVAFWMPDIRQVGDVKNDVSLYQLRPDAQHRLRYSFKNVRNMSRKQRLCTSDSGGAHLFPPVAQAQNVLKC